MTAEPGKLVGGKYRLEKPLAKGGMGSVWLARHTELDVPVAVKFMALELVGTPAAEARFKREAKAAAQLRSPHVVNIHDYGVDDGEPFMVMELLDGRDLAGELARVGRLPVERVAAIVAQIAKALALAHAAGIVHRDLKPANLFLSRSGEDEIVKVLDFGVAKETIPTLVVDRTTSGVLIGSPQYMSPEQTRGEQVDLRSDLWSLGVVAFEALTGSAPFDSTHLGALLAKINEARPAAPTSLAPELPAAIDTFMARALARQPEDRFPSARALADALTEIGGAPGAITAPAPSPAQPTGTPPFVLVPAATPLARDDATLPAGLSARSTLRDPGPPLARDDATLPAGAAEPDPVSTTMPDAPLLKEEAAPGQPRARRGIVLVGVLAAAAGALWFGLAPADPRGDTTIRPTPGASPATGDPAPTPGPPTVEPAGTAEPGGSGAKVPTATVPSTTAPSPAAASATTASSSRQGGALVPTAASATARPSATSAPAKTVTPTAAPSFDPLFGLPAPKP